MREEKFRLAGDEYARGFDKQPSTEMAVRQFRARRAAGKLGEAIEGLEGWVATHPDESDARRALAAGYIDSGQWEEALGAHESLLADLPDDAALLNNLAGLYLRTSNPQALEFAERAYRLAPKQSATLDTLGWVLVHEGKPAKALRYLREAHDRSATDLRVRYHIAAALDRLGRHQEARRELKRALRPGKQFEGHADAQALLEKLGG